MVNIPYMDGIWWYGFPGGSYKLDQISFLNPRQLVTAFWGALESRQNPFWCSSRQLGWNESLFVIPTGSMYGLYIYIYPQIYDEIQPNVGKKTVNIPYMDPMGFWRRKRLFPTSSHCRIGGMESLEPWKPFKIQCPTATIVETIRMGYVWLSDTIFQQQTLQAKSGIHIINIYNNIYSIYKMFDIYI